MGNEQPENAAPFLAEELHYLHNRAADYLSKIGATVDRAPEFDELRADTQYAELAAALALKADELGDACQPEILAAQSIYAGLSNLLGELHAPQPVDGSRIARLILAGVDLGLIDAFCDKVDDSPDEVEKRQLAAERLEMRNKGQLWAERIKAKASNWRPVAFVARAISLRSGNPPKAADIDAVAFLKKRLGIDKSTDAIRKAIDRDTDGTYAEIVHAVDRVLSDGLDTAPPALREIIAAAQAKFRPR